MENTSKTSLKRIIGGIAGTLGITALTLVSFHNFAPKGETIPSFRKPFVQESIEIMEARGQRQRAYNLSLIENPESGEFGLYLPNTNDPFIQESYLVDFLTGEGVGRFNFEYIPNIGQDYREDHGLYIRNPNSNRIVTIFNFGADNSVNKNYINRVLLQQRVAGKYEIIGDIMLKKYPEKENLKKGLNRDYASIINFMYPENNL